MFVLISLVKLNNIPIYVYKHYISITIMNNNYRLSEYCANIDKYYLIAEQRIQQSIKFLDDQYAEHILNPIKEDTIYNPHGFYMVDDAICTLLIYSHIIKNKSNDYEQRIHASDNAMNLNNNMELKYSNSGTIRICDDKIVGAFYYAINSIPDNVLHYLKLFDRLIYNEWYVYLYSLDIDAHYWFDFVATDDSCIKNTMNTACMKAIWSKTINNRTEINSMDIYDPRLFGG
jgi:hypothetical protein